MHVMVQLWYVLTEIIDDNKGGIAPMNGSDQYIGGFNNRSLINSSLVNMSLNSDTYSDSSQPVFALSP
jgi:hypothetical protein